MKKRILWLGVSFLLVTALVLASCAEEVVEEEEEVVEEEEEEEEVVEEDEEVVEEEEKQTKEQTYSTIDERYTEIRDGEPDEPHIGIEKGEFETDEEYNIRKSEKLKELEKWENTVLKYYRDNEETFLVVFDGVDIGQYDMGNGEYYISFDKGTSAQSTDSRYKNIFFPPDMSVRHRKIPPYRDLFMQYAFHVKVPVEKAKTIRELEQRGKLSINMTVYFDFADELNQSSEYTRMSRQDTEIYIVKATLNDKDGDVLYEW